MTVRSIPAAPVGDGPKNVRWEISATAAQRWQPLRNAAAGDNVISILDEIGADPWTGEGITAASVSDALKTLGNQPVTVEINSPGGSFFQGLAIYNALREHPQPVTVKVLGMAASAAAIVAMAGDTIMVARAGFMMIHKVMGAVMGNADELRDAADTMDPIDDVLADIFAIRSGLPINQVRKMLAAETWICGSDAVSLGMADSLLPSDQVDSYKNEAVAGPAAAMRRLDNALAKGERLTRAERRKLMNELAGKPGAAEEDDMPGAVENAVNDDDGTAGLRIALARFKLARA